MSAGSRTRWNTGKGAVASIFAVFVIVVVMIGVNANSLEPW
jgi:hypothetical protein